MEAQGWYRDPYGIHEDRYFSAGTPTKLVRDDGQESYDPAPDRPVPDGDLIPAQSAGSEDSPESDLERADQRKVDPVWLLIGGGDPSAVSTAGDCTSDSWPSFPIGADLAVEYQNQGGALGAQCRS